MAINLNREGVQLNGEERNKRNQNWELIEQNINTAAADYNEALDYVSEKAYADVLDASKLDWQEPVATFSELATTYPNALEGYTTQTTSDGSVYRFDGYIWKKIQQIDASQVNALGTRLSAQIEETDERINTVIANAGDGAIPSELVDIRTVNNKTYTTAGQAVRAIADGSALKTGAVSVEKTTFLSKGKNLMLANGTLANSSIDRNTGAVIANPNTSTSAAFSVPPNTTIVPRYEYRYVFRDIDANFISAGGASAPGSSIAGLPITTPVNAAFMQVAWKTTENPMQVEVGSVFTSYEPPLIQGQQLAAFDISELRAIKSEVVKINGKVSKEIEKIDGVIVKETTYTRNTIGQVSSYVIDNKLTNTKQRHIINRIDNSYTGTDVDFI